MAQSSSAEMERPPQILKLGDQQSAVLKTLARLKKENFVSRLWSKDASLWKSEPAHVKIIQNSLGWLTVADLVAEHLEELTTFAQSVKKEGFTDILLLGMGGSSLAPEVFRLSLPAAAGFPKLTVLDSTDPGWVLQAEKSVNLKKTLVIVASKSGTTTEPLSFYNYFWERTGKNGAQFVAITDPGSYLEGVAKEKKFKKIFLNPSDIGGRFSALSYFGMVPAALSGANVKEFLKRAQQKMRDYGAATPIEDNQALILGAVIGEMAKAGKDKVTLFLPKSLKSLGLWIEQLVAESSGKEGKGIVPIAGEKWADAERYGNDRLFVTVSIKGKKEAWDEAVDELQKKHPVVKIQLQDELDLGAEMLRWEIATAAACAIIGVDAFDQPDVQAAKDLTKKLLKELAQTGKLPETPAQYQGKDFKVTFSKKGTPPDLTAKDGVGKYFESFFKTVKEKDYFGILAYFPFDSALDQSLDKFRLALRDRFQAATLFGYGPRYLHSTGQLHKGGDDNGVFFVFTVDPASDIPVPESGYTFGQLEMAQAIGDFQALEQSGRRAVWIHLKQPLAASFNDAVSSILK